MRRGDAGSAEEELARELEGIFLRGSRTYSTASRFFPREFRNRVTILYAFVRTADDFVDCQPQDPAGFQAFRRRWEESLAGRSSGDWIVDGFCLLSRDYRLEPAWTRAFLDAMESDLSVRTYDSLEELLPYVYGSAEVIGLFMCRLLGLQPEAEEPARMLGRSMQFINFIRDFAEDRRLGRRYLPLDGADSRLAEEDWARSHPREFSAWIRAQIERYRDWGLAGREGLVHIPRRYRIPIATAQDMYDWTARRIAADPFLVFRPSLKPGKLRILLRILRRFLDGGLAR